MKKHGHVTRLIFLPSFDRFYKKEVIEQVAHIVNDSNVIGLSCTCCTSDRAEQLIKSLKFLKKIIVWGGIHATFDTTRCLDYADFVCVGEGEEAMLELIDAIEQNKDATKIKNVYTKKKNKIIQTPLRNVVIELDKLPFPDYDPSEKYVLDNKKIVLLKENHLRRKESKSGSFLEKYSRFSACILVHTSRGCQHSCSFCFNSYLKRLYKNKGLFVRTRSAKSVIAELVSLRKSFPTLQYIIFSDSSFFLRSDKEIETFSRLYKEKIGLSFMCNSYPPSISDHKLRLLVESGLNYINLGVQTGSESLNKNIYNRQVRNTSVLEATKLINKYKSRLIPEYQIITTNPYEKEEDILKTINLLAQIPKPYNLFRANLVFFPGSILYYKAKKDGLIKERDNSCYNLSYFEFANHLKVKDLKNVYIYYIIQSMGWNVTKRRYGIIPAFMLKHLINKRVINFCNNSKFVTRLVLPILINQEYKLFRKWSK